MIVNSKELGGVLENMPRVEARRHTDWNKLIKRTVTCKANQSNSAMMPGRCCNQVKHTVRASRLKAGDR